MPTFDLSDDARTMHLLRSAIKFLSIGLAVLVVVAGAALLYLKFTPVASIPAEEAKIYSDTLLQESAELRDAYSRYVFDRGSGATMTFDQSPGTGLFQRNARYGVYQPPPPQALVSGRAAPWHYASSIRITGVGTLAPESIIYLAGLERQVCVEINTQLYGTDSAPVIPEATIAQSEIANGAVITVTPTGRSTGCFRTSDDKFVFYSTLAEF